MIAEMAGKRIVFSTSTPNDQGFIIPNDVLDFTRFQKNPVLLRQHSWEELPLGLMTDIRYDQGEWTGVPVFHRMTELSRTYDDLWQSGFLTACSIGGFKELKTTGSMTRDKDGNKVPEIWTDKDGLAVATLFEVYEISMVTIPSNMDAVQKETFLKANADLNAKCYDEISVRVLEKEISTLSAKIQTMENENLDAAKLAAIEDEKVKGEAAAKLAADKEKAELAAKAKADDLPTPIKEAVEAEDKKKSGLGATIATMFKDALDALKGTGMNDDRPAPNGKLEAPTPKNLPETDGSAEAKAKIYAPLPEKVGTMSAKEQAQEKLEAQKLQATELQSEALAAKEKADGLEATQADKDLFASKKTAADEAFELCAKMESDVEDMDDTDEMKAKKADDKLAAKLAANKVRIKTMSELQAGKVKLAEKPNQGNRVVFTGGIPKTFDQLKADPQGKRLIEKVANRAYENLEPGELAIYLSAKRNDEKYAPVFDKARIVLGANDANYKTFRKSNHDEIGETVDHVIARLQSGQANWLNKNGQVTKATTLNATDDFLASPDVYAMEFLDLAIFKLFPTTSWKNDIPMFGAQAAQGNTGLIWTNIAASPAVYKGAKPVNPTNYEYDDDAIALNLASYWLQPMLWTPLKMAQFRYNQMDTGWAQAFATMGAFIDNDLIYQLALQVPTSSYVFSSGVIPSTTGGFTAPQTFTLNGNDHDPNSFIYNPLFAGTLNYPTLNDIIRLEQVYTKQNFELQDKSNRPLLVMDQTTDSLIAQTTQAQSLLTRWIDDDGEEQTAFRRTRFNERSQVVAYDPTTNQVKNPTGVIPSTVTSANLGYIPNQVGIGIGNLDVFMIQDPSAYGYKMSADVRMGIKALRKNGYGLTLFPYGPRPIS